MGRVVTPTCKTCNKKMTRMYVRPTGVKSYIPTGFICECGDVVFDDKRNEPFQKAWAYLKRDNN